MSSDWEGSACGSARRHPSKLRLITGILRAHSSLDSGKLLHFEYVLSVIPIVSHFLHSTVVNKATGHGACTSVCLWWVQHGLAERLVSVTEFLSLDTVGESLDLAVEVADDRLDGSAGS